MTKKRYLLCPGMVTSRTDGDQHYVDAHVLALLYGVRMDECVVLPYRSANPIDQRNRERLISSADRGELIALRPRYDGNYDMLKKQPGARQ